MVGVARLRARGRGPAGELYGDPKTHFSKEHSYAGGEPEYESERNCLAGPDLLDGK